MNCIFCKIVTLEIPAHIVYEDDQVMAFLDIHPQSRGHIQLIPKKHYRWVYEIENIGSFFTTAQKIVRGIIPVLGATYVRFATFGQEVEHAHLWMVPEYTVSTKLQEGSGQEVKSDALEELARILKNAL